MAKNLNIELCESAINDVYNNHNHEPVFLLIQANIAIYDLAFKAKSLNPDCGMPIKIIYDSYKPKGSYVIRVYSLINGSQIEQYYYEGAKWAS